MQQGFNNQKLTANGKLLLTGEYLVLDGASALALPISFTQDLTFANNDDNVLKWIASDVNGIWFECTFSLDNYDIIDTSDINTALNLQNIFRCAQKQSSQHFKTGITATSYMNFNRFLGLGSSSTLISLVASLFNTDKYKLHRMVSVGSGYDVACSGYDHPIIFTRKNNDASILPINYMPPFADCIWFAYLGNKQDTNNEIGKYKVIDKKAINHEVQQVTDITLKLAQTKDLTTFVSLIELHEKILSEILERSPIKHKQFSNFNGSIKSLGAWGGDFVLVVTDKGESYLEEYLTAHNINTFFRFNDIVLNKPVINNDELIIRF